jgi:hypothetical protein
MKPLVLAVAFAGILLTLNGCAVYAPPYYQPSIYYGYAPYGGVGFGFQPYGFYGLRPPFYG